MGIRVKNLTNKSRNNYLSKPGKYSRRSKKELKNIPSRLIDHIFSYTNSGNPSRFIHSHNTSKLGIEKKNYYEDLEIEIGIKRAREGISLRDKQIVRNIMDLDAGIRHQQQGAAILHSDGLHTQAKGCEFEADRLILEKKRYFKQLSKEIQHTWSLLKHKIRSIDNHIYQKKRQLMDDFQKSDEWKAQFNSNKRFINYSSSQKIMERKKQEIADELETDYENLRIAKETLKEYEEDLMK